MPHFLPCLYCWRCTTTGIPDFRSKGFKLIIFSERVFEFRPKQFKRRHARNLRGCPAIRRADRITNRLALDQHIRLAVRPLQPAERFLQRAAYVANTFHRGAEVLHGDFFRRWQR